MLNLNKPYESCNDQIMWYYFLMIILARIFINSFFFPQNIVDKSAQISVPILIDSLGWNKYTSWWRIVEDSRKKGEMYEKIGNVLSYAAQHVIFSMEVLSPSLLLSLSSLLVYIQG